MTQTSISNVFDDSEYLRLHLIRMSPEWYHRDKEERNFPDFKPGKRVIPTPDGPLPESDWHGQKYTYKEESAEFAMVLMLTDPGKMEPIEISSCGCPNDDFLETIEMRKLFHKMESQDVQEMIMPPDLEDPIQNTLMRHYNGARDMDRSDPELVVETYEFPRAFTVLYKPKIEVAKVFYMEERINRNGANLETYRGFYISTRFSLNMYPPAKVDLGNPSRHMGVHTFP